MTNDMLILKGIWLAIIVLAAVLVGGVAGLTSWAAGAATPAALNAAGAAFLGCATLGLASLLVFIE